MNYKPKFDTTIAQRTTTSNVTTVHTNKIDWEYPFDDPAHTSCICLPPDGKAEYIKRQQEYLRLCENNIESALASDYGGWPRIWKKVLGVGMVSRWPYWSPRPCVLVAGTYGSEWIDWNSLTGAEVKP